MIKVFMYTMAFSLVLCTAIQADIEEGLVLHYSFEKVSGENVPDDSGNGNDGTVIGELKDADGKFGKAAELSANNYIEAPTSESLEMADACTMACWVKSNVDIDAASEVSFVRKQHSGAGFILEFHGPSGGLCFWTAYPAGAVAECTIESGEWYHLAGSWDGATAKAYMNGVLLESVAADATGLNDQPVHIGGFGDPPGSRWYEGIIDEVVIYDRALTDQEITDLMDSDFAVVSPQEKLVKTWGDIKENF